MQIAWEGTHTLDSHGCKIWDGQGKVQKSCDNTRLLFADLRVSTDCQKKRCEEEQASKAAGTHVAPADRVVLSKAPRRNGLRIGSSPLGKCSSLSVQSKTKSQHLNLYSLTELGS